MHDQVLMRVLHRLTDVDEDLETAIEGECVFATVGRDRRALDVLHDEVRHAVVRHATVEQSGNRRVLKLGEHLPLGEKTAPRFDTRQPVFQQLDGDLLLKVAVRAFTQVDDAHAAFAEFAYEAVGANRLSNQHPGSVEITARDKQGRLFDRRAAEKVYWRVGCRQELVQMSPQVGIAAACLLDVPCARLGRKLDRAIENRAQVLPAGTVQRAGHSYVPLWRSGGRRGWSSRYRNARAFCHSRLMVRGVTLRFRAISSSVIPPKNRHSTICARRSSRSSSRPSARSMPISSSAMPSTGMALSSRVVARRPPLR